LTVLLLEEEPSRLNDGNCIASQYDANLVFVAGSLPNLLSIRHDRRLSTPERVFDPLPNPDLRGNVAFVDGHGAFMSRRDVHRAAAIDAEK
jgi:prepilin-type processing-associated H-X9-DG protein